MTSAEPFIYTEELYRLRTAPTVIISKPWDAVTSAELELLNKILSALRLSLNQIKIRHQPTLDLGSWAEKPTHVLFFGPLPAGITYYELIQVKEVSLVASEDLHTLLGNEAARKKLWAALKQLFSL